MNIKFTLAVIFILINTCSNAYEWNFIYKLKSPTQTEFFIFGGGHAGEKSLGGGLSSCVQQIAKDANQIVIELDPSEQIIFNEITLKNTGYRTKKIISMLDEKELNFLKEQLPQNELENFYNYPPYVIANWLEIASKKKTRVHPAYGSDVWVLALAVKNNIPVISLEEVDDQFNILLKIDDKTWLDLIKYNIALHTNDDLKYEDRKYFIKISKLYMTGNEKEIIKFTDKIPVAVRNFENSFAEARNISQIQKIHKIVSSLDKKTAFFAIGAQHISGKNSVIDGLVAKGYSAQRVCI